MAVPPLLRWGRGHRTVDPGRAGAGGVGSRCRLEVEDQSGAEYGVLGPLARGECRIRDVERARRVQLPEQTARIHQQADVAGRVPFDSAAGLQGETRAE